MRLRLIPSEIYIYIYNFCVILHSMTYALKIVWGYMPRVSHTVSAGENFMVEVLETLGTRCTKSHMWPGGRVSYAMVNRLAH